MNSFTYFILDIYYMIIFIPLYILLAFTIEFKFNKFLKYIIIIILCFSLLYVFPLIFLIKQDGIQEFIQHSFSSEQQDFATKNIKQETIGFKLCEKSNYGSPICKAYLKEKIERVKQEYAEFVKEECIKQQEYEKERAIEKKKIEERNNNIKKIGGLI